MPGYDLHPGVDATYTFPPEVRAAIVAMSELQLALTQVYDNARNRANHTGTQLAATISDFATQVRALAASETAQGTVERATTTEVQTMTDTTRYISPAGLAAAAVSAATANRIIRRDASGRAAVANPAAVGDIANKGYVDTTTNGRGTTTERDAFYGAYTTVAQQVAIANAVPMWFNVTTRRWETFYAVAGSAGLTVPGLFSGWFTAGWYAAPSVAADWAGKTGPAYSAPFKNSWTRGMQTPGSVMNAVADAGGIRIGLEGQYEVIFRQRGVSNANYATIALNGNRENLENRNNGTGTPPNAGIWGHDHPGYNNGYGESSYIGTLLAGDLITAGPQAAGTDLVFGTTATPAIFHIKRLG